MASDEGAANREGAKVFFAPIWIFVKNDYFIGVRVNVFIKQ